MNATQQEQLINIGTYLCDIRQEKGMAIDEVANQIFIRPALVKAIETGDWESLPEPVFVQGFIRRYADYLGLNGRELSQTFEPTPVSVFPNPEIINSTTVDGVIKSQDRPSLKVLSKAEPAQNDAALNAPNGSNRSWIGLIGLAAVAALIGLIGWLTVRNTPQRAASPTVPETVSTPDETSAAPTSEVAEAAPTELEQPDTLELDSSATNATPETLVNSGAPINFAVDVEADAWMRIMADGQRVYEGILTAGTQQSWTADTEMRITAGNSGGVMYSFNGSEEQPMGAPGAVANLTLTPETDPESLSDP